MKKAIPKGMSSFEKIRMKDCCYGDKTLLIKDLLHPSADEAMFITRPS